MPHLKSLGNKKKKYNNCRINSLKIRFAQIFISLQFSLIGFYCFPHITGHITWYVIVTLWVKITINFVDESHLFLRVKLQLRPTRQRHENRLYICHDTDVLNGAFSMPNFCSPCGGWISHELNNKLNSLVISTWSNQIIRQGP